MLESIEELLLENLPSGEFYEKSFMHKEIINHSKY